MFAKFLVPINPDDREIACGILPHISWLARTLASEGGVPLCDPN